MSGREDDDRARRWTPRELAHQATELYPQGSFFMRQMQRWRPHICPFDALLPFVPRGASVLDVGCGGGLFLGLLARNDIISRGVGFDSSHAAITIAHAMSRRIDSDLEFVYVSVEDSWPEGYFDVVSLIDVLHHVPPRAQRVVIHLAISRLKPGGRLLYKDMCRLPRWRAMANRLHDLVIARQWVHIARVAEVESWASEAGLRVIESARVNRLWYGHDLRVFR